MLTQKKIVFLIWVIVQIGMIFVGTVDLEDERGGVGLHFGQTCLCFAAVSLGEALLNFGNMVGRRFTLSFQFFFAYLLP